MPVEDKKNILVIDDDITVRKLIGFHLKAKNYSVFEASKASEGFEQLEKERIDLVLCDVTMEGMDGFTFCRKVRENEKSRVLPFVFITAKTSMEDKSRAMEVGGDDLITKPFNVQELLLKVQALLRRADIYKVYGTKKNLRESFAENTPKVLLIDDDVSLAKLFQYNITKAGFECAIAFNADEGFEMAKKNHPDIIISDIMMPKIDGFMLRKKILADDDLKGIPFLFLTSKGDETDILDGYDLGITDYIIKTAGPRVVVAKVSAIIKSLGKERQKVVTELHQAADSLRAKVVPDNFPAIKEFEIMHWHQPYQGIPGGDFLDYFNLDADNIAVVLGDVMGKKWGAWYFAFAYAGYVRSAIRVVLQTAKEFNPREILQQVNRSVYQDAKVSEVFATLSILIINKKNKIFKYAGAGDLPILFKKASTGEVETYQSKGLLLGFAEEGRYKDVTIQLEENDLIVLITDGIIETRNTQGIAFGSEMLKDTVKKIGTTDNPIDAVKKDFIEYTRGQFEDDISLITIRVK